MWVWKFATSCRLGSQSNELCKQRSAGRQCLVSSCLWNLIRPQTSWHQRSDAEGEGVLIINCHLSHCRHPLLGQQHPALCLPARPSELSRRSLYQPHVACFIQLSIPSQSMRHQWRITSVLVTADGMLTHVSHALEWGVDLYVGLEFWTFFQPQSQGVDLYADRLIRGNIR